MYFAASIVGTNKFGIQCFDLATNTSCGFFLNYTGTVTVTNSSSALYDDNAVGLATVGTKLYLLDSNGYMDCFDTATSAACTPPFTQISVHHSEHRWHLGTGLLWECPELRVIDLRVVHQLQRHHPNHLRRLPERGDQRAMLLGDQRRQGRPGAARTGAQRCRYGHRGLPGDEPRHRQRLDLLEHLR